jgi:hypothetical protein
LTVSEGGNTVLVASEARVVVTAIVPGDGTAKRTDAVPGKAVAARPSANPTFPVTGDELFASDRIIMQAQSRYITAGRAGLKSGMAYKRPMRWYRNPSEDGMGMLVRHARCPHVRLKSP